MPALVAGARPVADLIAAPADLGESEDSVVVHPRRTIIVLSQTRGRAPAARTWRGRQMVALGTGQPFRFGVVEGQAVQREVIGLDRQRRIERGHPAGQRLARDVVEEIHADRRDAGRPCTCHRIGDVLRAVPPAEGAQLGQIHALGAV